jgi:hypothetical protein
MEFLLASEIEVIPASNVGVLSSSDMGVHSTSEMEVPSAFPQWDEDSFAKLEESFTPLQKEALALAAKKWSQKEAIALAAEKWCEKSPCRDPVGYMYMANIVAVYFVVEFLIRHFGCHALVMPLEHYFPKVDGKESNFLSTLSMMKHFHNKVFTYYDGKYCKLKTLTICGPQTLCVIPDDEKDIRKRYLADLSEYIYGDRDIYL